MALVISDIISISKNFRIGLPVNLSVKIDSYGVKIDSAD